MGAAGTGCMSYCVSNTDDYPFERTPRRRLPEPISSLVAPCLSKCEAEPVLSYVPPPAADESNPYYDFRFIGDVVSTSKCKGEDKSEVDQWRKETGTDELGVKALNPLSQASQDTGQNDLHKYYRIERETLGAGSYGKCYKAYRRETDEIRAVKSLFKTKPESVAWAREEVRIMKLLDHPNIITLYDSFEDCNTFHIIMELCAGEALIDKLRDGGYFTEVQAMVLMQQIFRAVQHVHSMRICHRDLKPENFLLLTTLPLERNTLKMIDFGMSCSFKPGESLSMRAGTPYFTAPEVLKGRYTEGCDVWSCGVMLYVFLCGLTPFTGSTKEEILKAVEHGNFQFTGNAWRKVSDDAKNLVRECMTYDPQQRATAGRALNHIAITRRA